MKKIVLIFALAAAPALADIKWRCAPEGMPAPGGKPAEWEVEVLYENPPARLPAVVNYYNAHTGRTPNLWRCEHKEGLCEANAADLVANIRETLEEVGINCPEPVTSGLSGAN